MFWWRKKSRKVPAEELRQEAARLLRRGRYEEALALLERALRKEPANFEAHINLGTAYYLLATQRPELARGREGLMEEAVRHFEYVLGLDPSHATAMLNLAAAYNALGRVDEAVELLEKLTTQRPSHPDVHYNLALAYLQRGEKQRALEALRRELEINPRSPHAPDLLRQLEGETGSEEGP
ncbi:MAG TPA: tetratricopeptide repeat protein [Armatimonadetes bacterium]|nr:tetratricopeptide repeat protein [Armatimonadota bacterium]